MSTRLEKMVRLLWPQSNKKPQDEMRAGKEKIFYGSEENFIRNGAWVLEDSISLFHGRTNPIRHFSVDELNNLNVEYASIGYSGWYRGFWEGRIILVKMNGYYNYNEISREIVVATQMATHNNVHKLLGCCLETISPVLVYEWVAADTLQDRILHRDENHYKLPVLEWKDRLRVAWEISHAVSYLHTAFPSPIVHRYLQPDNIFLDQDNTAKLSNFSLSVAIPEGEEFVVQDFIVGTNGYMAPEYLEDRKVAEYTDVYSFGMLFLVLLTGKHATFWTTSTGEGRMWTNLIEWVTKEFRKEGISEIVDPAITKSGVAITELSSSIELALRCTATEENSRPTMVEVATELNDMIRSSKSIMSINSAV
ncbi:non-functional pseudokinase ZED1 [Beta vulgaris subsp. vulgaris]|uniref:non-functional pseudokinase ZED1 n=1 Tax=Beta vulgaris subsp. vulgaris TaxID=3555 RepID=UPI002036944F|nr:non-functional pseudokinase ZED1 [Beta vulgaris subsp. vulgaris]XP_048494002.1 non-functional pseudokinase ZED1 [Beta vulgaris subsp. vulgaris]